MKVNDSTNTKSRSNV